MDDLIFNSSLIEIIFGILKEENRRKILLFLIQNPMTADQITEKLDLTRPAIEKHLKQMLDIGLIERRAEISPTLHYLYILPQLTRDLINDLKNIFGKYLQNLEEEYNFRLSKIEQTFLLGLTSKEQYHSMKENHDQILSMIKSGKINSFSSNQTD